MTTAPSIAEAGPPSTIPVGRYEWERLIRDDPTLSTTAKAIALVIGTYASKDGDDIHPGNDKLAAGASASRSTVQRTLALLAERGLITKVRQGNRYRNRSDEWQLSMPDLLADPVEEPASEPDSAQQIANPAASSDRGGGEFATPFERARRKVSDALDGLEPRSAEWEARRAELAIELDTRVTRSEARELLEYSEIEYRAVMRRRGRTA
ncbi:helix-turn-helix domain-containing protein [Gordonia sp. NPDC062954]|uniref:helix-turn-helix domain-containing protein n=1 Tax=Gordonia sp. NPDC062954 TaxID=3364003 RepID=UPI0037C6DA41